MQPNRLPVFSRFTLFDQRFIRACKRKLRDYHAPQRISRSIKTLGVRVERQAENALAIAQWLGTLPEVTEVLYPGLADHPGYALQQKQASGAGGMISFKVRSAELAKAALGKLHLIAFAESLGGVETLLTYPIAQTHAEMPAALLKRTGLDDKLLRLSVGIEDVEVLTADLQQALQG